MAKMRIYADCTEFSRFPFVRTAKSTRYAIVGYNVSVTRNGVEIIVEEGLENVYIPNENGLQLNWRPVKVEGGHFFVEGRFNTKAPDGSDATYILLMKKVERRPQKFRMATGYEMDWDITKLSEEGGENA